MRRFAWDVPAMIEADGEELLSGSRDADRRNRFRLLFPSVDAPVYCEKYVLRNGGSAPVLVEIPAARSVIRTRADKGVEKLESVTEIRGDTTLTLAPQEEVAFGAFFGGRTGFGLDTELAARRGLIARLQEDLVLDTPDPVVDAMFAFAKIRAAESIYATRGDAAERYYAAIWAGQMKFFPIGGSSSAPSGTSPGT